MSGSSSSYFTRSSLKASTAMIVQAATASAARSQSSLSATQHSACAMVKAEASLSADHYVPAAVVKAEPGLSADDHALSAATLSPAKALASLARSAGSAAAGAKKRKRIVVTYEASATVKSEVLAWEPPNWLAQLQNIRKMREKLDAPVDTMGCDVISDRDATPQEYRYQVLLSLMLSSQTKDEVTSAAVARLRAHGCNVANILRTPDDMLGRLIYPVSFWKTKVLYIKKTSQMLIDKFDGDVPNTVEDLCSLAGVGPKMAHLVMRCAWQQTTGIAVDTHVHRISNRLGWVPKETTKPEETMHSLHSWLPREYWDEVNWLLVGFGQTVCKAIAPKCSSCLNKDICPFGKKFTKSLKRPLAD